VLDAGAGQGTFSARLARLGFAVTSTDVSAAAVEVLRTRLGGEVVQADLEALPFAGESFDAVVLGEVLEHVEDDLQGLCEVARVLRPGGLVAASVPANPKLFGPSDVWAGHHRRYTREGLISLVEEAGLSVERCLPWGFPLSALYHRQVYERHLQRRGTATPTGGQRPLVAALGAALQVDRLFVGVERGSLGLLLRARRP
jgi:SAM-dependent methyltransferase